MDSLYPENKQTEKASKIEKRPIETLTIGPYSVAEYLNMIESFHGYAAPGLIMGGVMVDIAQKALPADILHDAVCETYNCLPDAIQMLTPCTVGNGWLKVFDFGRYALSLYDKNSGEGIRVYVAPKKLEQWDEVNCWFFKRKPKKEQDSQRLKDEIILAGPDLYHVENITILPEYLEKRDLGTTNICPICNEAYPVKHGNICKPCQGDAPYQNRKNQRTTIYDYKTHIKTVPVIHSEGTKAIHDMTQIIPGKSKGPAFRHGQTITAGDICRLQQMGKQYVFTETDTRVLESHIHENDVALAFASAMAGEGITYMDEPREGKIDFIAERDGLLVIDTPRLEAFNLVPGVMCATRKNFSVVKSQRKVAGTRAIPLYLPQKEFYQAMNILSESVLLNVMPFRKAAIGILVTGTEIFNGVIQDKFIPIITAKTLKMGCRIVKYHIVPDERDVIKDSIIDLIISGADLIITTAGLSVDPDDVTRQGLLDAGAENILYGMPILPGAMTLLANINDVQIIGVPACALYYPTTSFDLLLPRLLAGIDITRQDLARLGHGAFCWGCKTCSYPKCSFGKD